MNRTRLTLVALALALSVAGAAFGRRSRAPAPPAAEVAIPAMDAFAVAGVLSVADIVVVTLDAPKHPLRGAVPASMFGADDEAFVKAAPAARRIVLAGAEPGAHGSPAAPPRRDGSPDIDPRGRHRWMGHAPWTRIRPRPPTTRPRRCGDSTG